MKRLFVPLLFSVAISVFSLVIPLIITNGSQMQTSSSQSTKVQTAMKSNGSPTLRIIDISHNDNVTDWSALKKSVDAIYIKATEGITYTDPMLNKNASAAVSAGIPMGFFHYFWPKADVNDAVREADFYYNAIKSYPYKLIPVLDVEESNGLSPEAVCSDVKAFADEFLKDSGQTIMIYCSPNFANANLTNSNLSRYPLWVACYNSSTPPVTKIWKTFDIWQYSMTYTISGVSNKVDVSAASSKIFLSSSSSSSNTASSKKQ